MYEITPVISLPSHKYMVAHFHSEGCTPYQIDSDEVLDSKCHHDCKMVADALGIELDDDLTMSKIEIIEISDSPDAVLIAKIKAETTALPLPVTDLVLAGLHNLKLDMIRGADLDHLSEIVDIVDFCSDDINFLYDSFKGNEAMVFENHYLCECGEIWESNGDAQHDDRCPECNTSNEAMTKDEFLLALPKKLKAGDLVDLADPTDDCAYNCAFTGTVDFVGPSHVTIRDMEDNYIDVDFGQVLRISNE